MAGTSEKDIKLLWGRAAGRCSYCQCDLTHIMDGLGNYHVGEMAHVIGKKKGAARTTEGTGPDTYDNLILLCPTHHRMIDKAPEGAYPNEMLFQWKEKHESSVVNAFKGAVFESVEQLKEDIALMLYENNKCFTHYGPYSEVAKDMGSNAQELWELKKLSVMVPNNRKIINVIEGNMGLLSARQKRLYIDFRDHAEAWEYNQYNRLDVYPLFPQEFQKEFGYE